MPAPADEPKQTLTALEAGAQVALYRVALSRRRCGQAVERRWCQPGMLV
jgi:hypothetical protein